MDVVCNANIIAGVSSYISAVFILFHTGLPLAIVLLMLCSWDTLHNIPTRTKYRKVHGRNMHARSNLSEFLDLRRVIRIRYSKFVLSQGQTLTRLLRYGSGSQLASFGTLVDDLPLTSTLFSVPCQANSTYELPPNVRNLLLVLNLLAQHKPRFSRNAKFSSCAAAVMFPALTFFLTSLTLALTSLAEPSLLDIVRGDPDLSTLASIIAKTGHDVANPGIVGHTDNTILKILTASRHRTTLRQTWWKPSVHAYGPHRQCQPF